MSKKVEETAVAKQISSLFSAAKERDSYVVFGKRYFPINDATKFEETGVASWYGKKSTSIHRARMVTSTEYLRS